jgi:hypothetical protein
MGQQAIGTGRYDLLVVRGHAVHPDARVGAGHSPSIQIAKLKFRIVHSQKNEKWSL